MVDVSGAASTVHPSTLALVDAAARMAESYLREEHHAALNALRGIAAPLLAGSRQPMLVTDSDGWVAAAIGTAATDRIALPDGGIPTWPGCRPTGPAGWSRSPAAGWSGCWTTRSPMTPATTIEVDLRNPADCGC